MKTNNLPDIRSLFEPASVAVLGASTKPSKIGYKICENIVAGGYTGTLCPINPSGGEILGHTIYPSLMDCPCDVDVAVISIPAKYVFPAVKECAQKGVKHLVIITSGFAEVGEGDLEREIVAYAREHGMRVLGPNIFGLYSSSVQLNATFGPKDVLGGGVSIITQSGAIGIAMIGKTKVQNIGLSSIISCGNKADIDEADLLDYLENHDPTKIILMYMEGVREGDKLVRKLRQVTQKKPVVVIKSGRSKRGAMAAASHTGSLAGADGVFDAIIKQCGAIRATSLEQGLDWCKFLATSAAPKGEQSVIITNGGGIGVLGTDACEEYDVAMYDDQEALREAFADACPSYGSCKNPVDITGGATAEDYDACLEAALKHPAIHSVICMGCETAVFNAEAFTKIIERRWPQYRESKPIVFALVGGEEIEDCIRTLKGEDVPIYGDVHPAIGCLGALYRDYRWKRDGVPVPTVPDLDLASVQKVIDGARAENRTFLLAQEGQAVMRALGVSVPESRLATSADAAVAEAAEIGYPVVMKVVSKDIIHKSDAGGLALDLESEEEVRAAWDTIMTNCRKHKPDADIKGIEVAEMLERKVETILGARQDAGFGPTVMFGLGGIYVEVLKDVTFRSYPLSRQEAGDMLKSVKSYKLLEGVRGEPPKDVEATIDTLLKIGAVLAGCPDISDIEINPLLVNDDGDGVKAVDVRILLTKPEK